MPQDLPADRLTAGSRRRRLRTARDGYDSAQKTVQPKRVQCTTFAMMRAMDTGPPGAKTVVIICI